MTLALDDSATDHAVWNEPCSMRFVEAVHAVIMVPSGSVRPRHRLGHAAVRRRRASTSNAATDERCAAAARTTATTPRCAACCRESTGRSSMIALQALDVSETADVDELIVERDGRGDVVT